MTELLQQIRARLEARVGGASDFANSFNDRTMRDTHQRAARELDGGAQLAVETIEGVAAALTGEGLQDSAAFDEAAFLDRFVNAWAAYQHAGARTANWMVTGPARFPVERNRKRMDTEHRRWQELDALCKAAPHRAVKDAKRLRDQQLGPAGVVDAELADLKARLDKRETYQRQMKAVNEMIRRHKFVAGDGAQLSAAMKERGFAMNPNLCGMLLNRESWQRPGFETYQLSNNLAEIKRLQGRIADVERKAQAIESEPAREQEINGVRIVEDPVDNRLRLLFDGKPAQDVITALKSRGFRWSPRNSAWQRQLTGNARLAAAAIVERLAA